MRRAMPALAIVAVVLTTLGACSPAAPAEITVTERDGIFDPVGISASGLPAGEEVELLSTALVDSVKFSSKATFLVSDSGTIDVARDAPLSGDWDAADAMAPLWALASSNPRGFGIWDEPHTVELAFTDSDGELLAEASVDRPGVAEGVTSRPVQVNGIAASYATPADLGAQETRTAVLVFSGSEGGRAYADLTARWLAGLGYPALAIAYFDHPGLPQKLTQVPVETFENGLHWLREQPEVDLSRVFTYGISRGGEMALWLAAEHPDLVYGAIAPVGAGVLVCGLEGYGVEAWTRNGQPMSDRCENSTRSIMRGNSEIDVAAIRGPVVLACGTKDTLWDSCRALDDITERRAVNAESETLATRQDGASHFLSNPPYMPSSYEPEPLDSRAETRAAQLSFWNDVASVLAAE